MRATHSATLLYVASDPRQQAPYGYWRQMTTQGHGAMQDQARISSAGQKHRQRRPQPTLSTVALSPLVAAPPPMDSQQRENYYKPIALRLASCDSRHHTASLTPCMRGEQVLTIGASLPLHRARRPGGRQGRKMSITARRGGGGIQQSRRPGRQSFDTQGAGRWRESVAAAPSAMQHAN